MNYPIELRRREAAAIAERRRKANPSSAPESDPVDLPDDTVALALSGGGIRCATFSLGVLQSLARKKKLRSIDILSSVSGGGYTAGFLGRLFTRDAVCEHVSPCERVEEIVGDNDSTELQWLRTQANYIVSQGGSDVRDHLAVFWRNLASIYFVLALLGVVVVGLLRVVGNVLQRWLPIPDLAQITDSELFVGLSVWWSLPPAIVAFVIVPASMAYWLAPKPRSKAMFSFFPFAAWLVVFIALSLGLSLELGLQFGIPAIGITLIALLILELARCNPPAVQDPSSGESTPGLGIVIRNRITRFLGEVVVFLFLTVAWVAIDTVARGLAEGKFWRFVAAWGALLMPALPFLRRWATSLGAGGGSGGADGAKPSRSIFTSRAFRAGLIAFPVATLLIILLDCAVHIIFNYSFSWGMALIGFGVVLSFVLGRAFDFLNYSALQQSYGARLSRTFLGASNPARSEAAASLQGRDVAVTHPDDDVPFYQYHPERAGGPLHLIGLCVNETIDAASERGIRDRKGLPMCVTPCGVSVGRRFHACWTALPPNLPFRVRLKRLLDGLGPVKPDAPVALRAIPVGSESFHVLKGKTDAPVAVESLSLGTWVAVSGAAFGTGTGRSTSLPLALLLGLVNLRLGYWWDSGLNHSDRPGKYPRNLWRRLKSFPSWPVKMQSLLLSDFKGQFGGPSHRHWNISDGGHFDVTGVYELVRRRVPFIIAVDGGEDPRLEFADFAELVRQCRIDFGAKIEFVDDPATAPASVQTWLQPGAIGKVSDIGKPDGMHATLAKITYAPPDPATRPVPRAESWLLILKASVTGDESLDIAAYKRAHSDFPGEPTTDQFFDESQWESYRMLGQHVGESVIA